GSAISTASSAENPPRVASTPADRSDRPPSTRARRAPASTTMVPEDPTAKAIHSLRAGGIGDDRLHPRPHGDLGCGQLRGHAPAAHLGAGSAGDPLELVVDLHHL